MTAAQKLSVPIDAIEFTPNGPKESDPAATLHASILIAGVMHHFHAIAVNFVDGMQQAVDGDADDYLGDYYHAFAPDQPFNPIHINGREYVLFLCPGT